MPEREPLYLAPLKNASYFRCIRQGAQGWCTGMTQRDGMGREVGWGTHVHPWLIHVNVWQNHYNIVK